MKLKKNKIYIRRGSFDICSEGWSPLLNILQTCFLAKKLVKEKEKTKISLKVSVVHHYKVSDVLYNELYISKVHLQFSGNIFVTCRLLCWWADAGLWDSIDLDNPSYKFLQT